MSSRTRIGHLQQEEAQQLVGTLTRKASTRVELQEVHEFDELVGGFASYTGDLCEAEISWAPTYKFKKSDFDAKRAPSYCDRVLWRADPNVLPRLYAHCPEVTPPTTSRSRRAQRRQAARRRRLVACRASGEPRSFSRLSHLTLIFVCVYHVQIRYRE